MRIHSRADQLFILILLVCTLMLSIPAFSGASSQPATEKYVSIDFNDVDIRVFIKFMSELTRKNFIIDNRVKGKVNIISPGKITITEAFQVFESVLEVHGFTTVKAGEVTKIIPRPTAASKGVETLVKKDKWTAQDKIVTQIIPLEYADAELVRKLMAPMISKGSVIQAYAPTNTLIVTDAYSNIRRLMKILGEIDVKDVGRQITVFPMQYADAKTLVKTLTTLFKGKTIRGKKAPADQLARFVYDDRTNAIILLATEFDTAKVRDLIQTMDQDVPKSDAKIRVIYLENAKAEDLAEVLQSLSGKKASQSSKDGKKQAPVVSDKVKITHDSATNSLIIMADKEDYDVLEGIVKKLDIPRPMVYIEALIMEVRDTDDFSIGAEWNFGKDFGTINGQEGAAFGGFTPSGQGSVSALPTVSNGAAALAGGFSVGLMTEAITIGGITFPSLGAAIKAIKSNEKVRIISTPQIMTTDNEEAEINVGENIPYLTSSSTGDNNYNNYEYKDVGVTLKITPQISQGRFVRLNIYQKVEKLTNISTVAASATPTTLKRTAETTVVIKDASTVVIGGLIGEDLNSKDYKVPCLGDIPGLGHMFRSTTRNGVQTNLYIFLTPRIIENPVEAEKVYQEKQEHIKTFSEKQIPLYKDKDGDKSPKTNTKDEPK